MIYIYHNVQYGIFLPKKILYFQKEEQLQFVESLLIQLYST